METQERFSRMIAETSDQAQVPLLVRRTRPEVWPSPSVMLLLAMLLGLILVLPGLALAQTGGSAGGAGGGDRPTVRWPIDYTKPSFSQPCREGEQLLMPDQYGQAMFEVKTCTNGRFYPPQRVQMPSRICDEGVTYLVPGAQEGAGYEFRTCSDGRLYPRQKTQPRGTRCIEGERFLAPDPRSTGTEATQLIEVECRNGRLLTR